MIFNSQKAVLVASITFAIGLCVSVVTEQGVGNFPVMVAEAAIPALGGLLAGIQGAQAPSE